jgi:predicted nucleic acid-binding protein
LILVDTSVWIDHFRDRNDKLAELLGRELVLTHSFVLGELACGNLRNRERILADLALLPGARPARHEEVLLAVDERRLWGKGIGWIDAHLLTSAMITKCGLWTYDRALTQAASALGLRV